MLKPSNLTRGSDCDDERVVIIGGGFTGLAAAYELGLRGIRTTILERGSLIGGLASGYEVGGQVLERFYHHWFVTDCDIIELVRELGLEGNVLLRSTNTGVYYAKQVYRLSRPIDILRFRPLTPVNRLRLGMLIAYSWTVTDLHSIEPYTAKEWLLKFGGRQVYEVVWEPLLIGKFGEHAEDVGAAWLWNKFIQRGRSRQQVWSRAASLLSWRLYKASRRLDRADESARGRYKARRAGRRDYRSWQQGCWHPHE